MHDRGGWPTDAPIDRSEHELADWELLHGRARGRPRERGVMNVDELRRGIESMPPEAYERGVVLRALAVLRRDDPDREGRARARRARREARRGEHSRRASGVRVAARAHEGHHRTPGYLKGKSGTVERVHGAFTNPETRAYGDDGLPEQPLYLVGFAQRECGPTIDGHAGDRVLRRHLRALARRRE